MATRHTDTEHAVLSILKQYQAMTMDEIIHEGQPDFTWGEVFLAINRLSRRQLVVLSRAGSTYHVALNPQTLAVMEIGEPAGSAAQAQS